LNIGGGAFTVDASDGNVATQGSLTVQRALTLADGSS